MASAYAYCALTESNLPDYAEALAGLQSQLTPEQTTVEDWRWRYLDNPERASVALIALRDGRPVGKTGVIATRLRIRGMTGLAGLVEGFVIDESSRSWECYRGLLAASYEHLARHRLVFSFAQTPTDVMKMNCALGHRSLGRLPIAAGLASVQSALRARGVPAILAACGNLAQPFAGLRVPPRTPGIEIQTAREFDPGFDNVWATARRQWPIAAVKDAAYLNWRYARRPNRQFVALEARRGDRPAGMLAMLVRSGLRNAFIMEMLAENDDPAVMRSLLGRAIELARAAGVGAVRASFPELSVEHSVLRKAGFSNRLSSAWDLNFLIATSRAGDEAPELEAGNWFTSGGDWLHD